jgi:hypothetical protein
VRTEKQTAAARANLSKYREKHPEGPRFEHGAHSRHFRKRFSDARTTQGRRLKATLDALRAEFAPIGAAQAIILERLREKLISAACLGLFLDRQLSPVTDAGELIPCARQAHALSESIRKDLELLHTLAARRPPRGPSLAEYLAGKRKEQL